jgi:hypothetical protein
VKRRKNYGYFVEKPTSTREKFLIDRSRKLLAQTTPLKKPLGEIKSKERKKLIEGFIPSGLVRRRGMFAPLLGGLEGKERRKAYHRLHRQLPSQQEHRRAWAREYKQRPEVKERQQQWLKRYMADPAVKERKQRYVQEYIARPEVKARYEQRKVEGYFKEYARRPDVKEYKSRYQKIYTAVTPESRRVVSTPWAKLGIEPYK